MADQDGRSDIPARADGWTLWWPLLLGPAGMGAVYLCRAAGWGAPGKPVQEQTALVILGMAIGASVALWRCGPNPWHRVLTLAAAMLFCRELHFAGTGPGIYAGLVLLAILIVRGWDQLGPWWFGGRFRFWMVSTGAAYLLSQLIARRVFREIGLPHEDEVHVALEEIVENVAHLLLFLTTLIGACPPLKRREEGAGRP